MADVVNIDGSVGEGGGQILRSSLALAIATGRGVRIEKIRAGREKPGLLRQHLTAMRAAVEISGGEVEGAELGSRELVFRPGAVRAGEYRFAVGTAGSATLVLQTILMPLVMAGGKSTVMLEGGTHNPFAPPFPFLERAFLPVLRRMGAKVEVRLERAGFYPAGGGRMVVEIEPGKLERVEIMERGEVVSRACVAVVAGLSEEIAERELKLVERMMGWPAEAFRVERMPGEWGPGNLVYMEIGSENVTEVFTGFGERGVRAEAVAEGALKEAKRYLAAGVAVGPCLADQLMLPMALAGGGAFVTVGLTRHSRTNMGIIEQFLEGVRIEAGQEGRDRWGVRVGRR